MRKFIFDPDALEQFSDCGFYDRQRFAKIYDLIKDVARTPFTGKGKPEALKHQLKCCWSRRIDDKHRLTGSLRTAMWKFYPAKATTMINSWSPPHRRSPICCRHIA